MSSASNSFTAPQVFLSTTQGVAVASNVAASTAGHLTTLPTQPATQSSSSVNPGLIAGPVVGGVAIVAIVAFLVMYFGRKKRSSHAPAAAAGVGAAEAPPSAPMGKIPNATISDHSVESPDMETPYVGSTVYSAPISSGDISQDAQEDNEEDGPLSLPN